jgi:hypothetical protein
MGGVRHFDGTTAAEAFRGPGGDTRQWVSFGLVDPDTDQQRSVEFTPEYGPLVSVTLQPSGVPCRCRVAHEVAGNGEGEWFPFLAGDEVLVVLPEGDDGTAVITGRLNQEIDAWPTQVAGQDTTKNTLAFRRLRTPYILETAAGYLIRSATTGAFFGITPAGGITISDADNAFLTLTPSLIGLQNGPGDCLIQIDVEGKQVILEAAGTKLVLDANLSSLYSTGVVQIGSSGNQAAEHATSIEAVVNLLQVFLLAASAAATAPPALVTFFASFSAPSVLAGFLQSAAALALDPALAAAIQSGLAIPKVPGTKPGLGAPGFMIG